MAFDAILRGGANERNGFGAKMWRQVAERNRLRGMRMLLLLVSIAIVAAQNRNVPIENEFVRVLSVTDQPVTKPGALHEHKENRVMVYLDAGEIQIRYADGRVDNQHWKAGDVAWSPAGGMHTSQNVSSAPIRIVEIEIRAQGGGKTEGGPPSLIDNNQVRVYRTSRAVSAKNFVATDIRTGTALWNRMPDGPGPFVITELKPQLHGDTEPR
jgi:uncharacterized RmlC-like cupin family protein